jgi:hypothetical protein
VPTTKRSFLFAQERTENCSKRSLESFRTTGKGRGCGFSRCVVSENNVQIRSVQSGLHAQKKKALKDLPESLFQRDANSTANLVGGTGIEPVTPAV